MSTTEEENELILWIEGRNVPLIHDPSFEEKKRFPIHFMSDKKNSNSLVLRDFPNAKRKHRWRRSKSIPMVVLLSCRGCHRRTKLLEKCRKAKVPMILVFYDGGLPGQGLAPPGLRFNLDLGNNVLAFAWTVSPSPIQKTVLEFLQRNWDQVPFDAVNWLAEQESIVF